MTPAETDAARELADKARARADAATDPPWTAAGQYDDGAVVAECAPCDVVRAPHRRGLDGNECEANARFVAAARTDVPALADALTAALDALAAEPKPLTPHEAAALVEVMGLQVEIDAMRERAEKAEAERDAERAYRVASNHALVAGFALSAAPPICCVEDAERVAELRDAARSARAAAVAAEDALVALGVEP